jgi:multiple sugar transport system substrate-binding protein
MEKLSRRDFLGKTGKVAAAAAVGATLLGGRGSVQKLFAESGKAAGPAKIMTEDQKWKQFAGETIKVCLENTPPSLGIKAVAKGFSDLTGMKVEFTLDGMDALKQKIFLDLRGGNPSYHIVYGQPTPIGGVVVEYLTPISKFCDQTTGKSVQADLPDVPDCPNGLIKAFEPKHFEAGSQFYEKDVFYGLPYDDAQSVLYWRNDIWATYGKKYQDKYGRPMKPTANTSWEEIYNICMFLKTAAKDEIDAPLGLHFGQGWPIASEYCRFLRAFGVMNEGYEGIKDQWMGYRNPGPYLTNKGDFDKAIQVIEWMKKIRTDILHPDAMVWEWGALGTAFATGKIAIMTQCGEFCPYIEDPKQSKAAGKTSYGVVPKGPAGINAYEVGPSSIMIPNALPEREQKKAWLFELWATGPEAQWQAFTTMYGSPVRVSAYEKARKNGWFDEKSTFRSSLELPAQENELNNHIDGYALGPKVPFYNELLDVQGSELSKFVSGQTSAKDCLKTMAARLNKLAGA